MKLYVCSLLRGADAGRSATSPSHVEPASQQEKDKGLILGWLSESGAQT